MPPKSIKNVAADAEKLKIVQPIGNFFKAQKKVGRPKNPKKANTLAAIFDAADKRDKTSAAAPAAAAQAAAPAAAHHGSSSCLRSLLC